MAKREQLKAGDLVRAPARSTKGQCCAGFRQGQVVEVRGVEGRVIALHGSYSGLLLDQWVECSELKLAKQAMKKRDQYASRRG